MAVLIFTFVLVGTIFEKKEIYWHQETGVWGNAQDYCRYYYMDLLTISDPSENQRLTYNGWIGLRWHDLAWRWSRGNVKANYTNWNAGEPQSQSCAVKSSSGFWLTTRCTSELSFYCYDRPLVLVKENKTWEEALEHCRALDAFDPFHRYDMAELLTTDNFSAAQEMVQKAAVDGVWLGLRLLGDKWSWVNGKIYSWGDCAEDKRCGMLEKDAAAMTKELCQRKQYFLCSRKYAT